MIVLLTNAEARESYPDDYEDVDIDVGAGDIPPAAMGTIRDLDRELGDARLEVMRDWEGCIVLLVNGAKGVPGFDVDVVCVSGNGRVGRGGVNMPRYYDSVADMLANRTPSYVTWKDEGRRGPATVVDPDAVKAWRVAQGLDPDGWGIPFGSNPDGIRDLGWLTRAQAKRTADNLGLRFEES